MTSELRRVYHLDDFILLCGPYGIDPGLACFHFHADLIVYESFPQTFGARIDSVQCIRYDFHGQRARLTNKPFDHLILQHAARRPSRMPRPSRGEHLGQARVRDDRWA